MADPDVLWPPTDAIDSDPMRWARSSVELPDKCDDQGLRHQLRAPDYCLVLQAYGDYRALHLAYTMVLSMKRCGGG